MRAARRAVNAEIIDIKRLYIRKRCAVLDLPVNAERISDRATVLHADEYGRIFIREDPFKLIVRVLSSARSEQIRTRIAVHLLHLIKKARYRGDIVPLRSSYRIIIHNQTFPPAPRAGSARSQKGHGLHKSVTVHPLTVSESLTHCVKLQRETKTESSTESVRYLPNLSIQKTAYARVQSSKRNLPIVRQSIMNTQSS